MKSPQIFTAGKVADLNWSQHYVVAWLYKACYFHRYHFIIYFK